MIRSREWDHPKGISVVIKDTPETSLQLLVMQGPSEKITNYKPRSRLHQILNLLDFQAYRPMRNKFLLYINHPTYDILLQQLEYTETSDWKQDKIVCSHHS